MIENGLGEAAQTLKSRTVCRENFQYVALFPALQIIVRFRAARETDYQIKKAGGNSPSAAML